MSVQHFPYIYKNSTVYMAELTNVLIIFSCATLSPPAQGKGYLNGTDYNVLKC
jgi:hypothetical protein